MQWWGCTSLSLLVATLRLCEAHQLRRKANEILHYGEDCWVPCGNQAGHCSWCGMEGLCCRNAPATEGVPQSDAPECVGADAPSDIQHQCIPPPEGGPALESVALYAQNLKQESDESEVKSLHVFVFSRVDGYERRGQIRGMWQYAKENSPGVETRYKFAVCGGQGNTVNADNQQLLRTRDLDIGLNIGDDGTAFVDLDEATKKELYKELHAFDDVIYLECEEGYGEGALTKKVLASMAWMWDNKRSDYFMKIDDDTFIAWNRYAEQLHKSGSHNIYMGIPIGEGVPCRNKDFRWYEPWYTFRKAIFPKGMSGGSGYTIGRNLVDMVLHAGIGEKNVLFNEDRAVGVWMDTIRKSGTNVQYVGLAGIDGFWAWNWRTPTEDWATWGTYVYVLHHGLEGETIKCLSNVEHQKDDTARLGQCFKSEVGKAYEPLKCALQNKEAQQEEKGEKTQALVHVAGGLSR